MGVIMGIIWFVTGMHWAFALGYLIMAIVADFVAGAGQYKSKKLNSLSYILFSLGGTGSYIVFFADPNGWAQTMLGNGTEQSYIDTMQATANTGILIAMFAAAIITSAISAFVGCKMLKSSLKSRYYSMSGKRHKKGLWLDPRAKLFLILMCVLSSMFAPSLAYQFVLVMLIAVLGAFFGKWKYVIKAVCFYAVICALTVWIMAEMTGTLRTMFIAF